MIRKPLLFSAVSVVLCLFLTNPAHAFFNSDIKKAKDFIQAGMYPQAIEQLNKRINEEPTDAEAHLSLGQCYAHQGNWGQAEQRFNSAVKLDPGMKPGVGKIYKDLAYSNLKSNNLSSAESNYSKAVGYDASLASSEFQKQLGYRYLKLATESSGSAKEMYKQRATGYVGADLVAEVFPGAKTVTVFKGEYTDSDITEPNDDGGWIPTVDWSKIEWSKVGQNSALVIEGDIPPGCKQIYYFRGKEFNPSFLPTQNGIESIPINSRPGKGKFLIWIQKGKGIKATVSIIDNIIPSPKVELLNSLIK